MAALQAYYGEVRGYLVCLQKGADDEATERLSALEDGLVRLREALTSAPNAKVATKAEPTDEGDNEGEGDGDQGEDHDDEDGVLVEEGGPGEEDVAVQEEGVAVGVEDEEEVTDRFGRKVKKKGKKRAD